MMTIKGEIIAVKISAVLLLIAFIYLNSLQLVINDKDTKTAVFVFTSSIFMFLCIYYLGLQKMIKWEEKKNEKIKAKRMF